MASCGTRLQFIQFKQFSLNEKFKKYDNATLRKINGSVAFAA